MKFMDDFSDLHYSIHKVNFGPPSTMPSKLSLSMPKSHFFFPHIGLGNKSQQTFSTSTTASNLINSLTNSMNTI